MCPAVQTTFAQVEPIAEAADAFVEMLQRMPDIIITGWKMEPLDGLDLIRLIRKGEDSPNPCPPIILLTGYTKLERVTEARDTGASSQRLPAPRLRDPRRTKESASPR